MTYQAMWVSVMIWPTFYSRLLAHVLQSQDVEVGIPEEHSMWILCSIISFKNTLVGYTTQLLTPSRIKCPHAALALNRAKLLDKASVRNNTASRTKLHYIV